MLLVAFVVRLCVQMATLFASSHKAKTTSFVRALVIRSRSSLAYTAVAELLAASHTGLDEPSDTASAAPGQCPESRRSAGLILLVTINYNNVDHNPIMCMLVAVVVCVYSVSSDTYSVLRVANAEYKANPVCCCVC